MSGHVRRSGARSWELKYELGYDASGRRRSRFVSFKGTKREAQAELARLIVQHASGAGVDPSKATLAEFAQRWDRDWASLNLGGKALERYRGVIRLMIVPHLGGLPIQKLRATHLAELYAKLSREGGVGGQPLANGSVTYAHAVIRRMLGHAVAWGVVTTNVATTVSPPSAASDSDEITILTQDQVNTVLSHLNGQTLRPIVSFLLGTGCRRGEALALQWKDIDFDRGIVRIERSVEQNRGWPADQVAEDEGGSPQRRDLALAGCRIAGASRSAERATSVSRHGPRRR